MGALEITPDFDSFNPEEIKRSIEGLNSEIKKNDLFIVHSANEWLDQAKKTPIPKMLCSELWFEGEICIMFADSNVGKSIFAVQIADSITKGKPIQGFSLEVTKTLVMYFDFELSNKQFEIRYSVKDKDNLFLENHYSFSNDFKRVEISPDINLPDKITFEDYLIYSLEKTIIDTGIKILIIDNLTYLNSENEKAKNATPLMKKLKALKTKYNLSLLVLAHTPKRDLSKPITANDLQGSKMLMNFADSSFTIGTSSLDKDLRYIKQIKARNTEIVFDSENVAICQLQKPNNFLAFEFLKCDSELNHLRQVSVKDKDNLENEIIELKKEEPSLSLRLIADRLGTNQMKVQRVLKRNNIN